MNKVIICGNLGADPDLRVTQGDMAILKLRIATNERKKQGERWVDHTEWHRCTMFGERAQKLATYLEKGSKVLIEGVLRTSSYDKDGQKHWSTEIVVNDIELLGGKQSSGAPRSAAAPAVNYDELENDVPF